MNRVSDVSICTSIVMGYLGVKSDRLNLPESQIKIANLVDDIFVQALIKTNSTSSGPFDLYSSPFIKEFNALTEAYDKTISRGPDNYIISQWKIDAAWDPLERFVRNHPEFRFYMP